MIIEGKKIAEETLTKLANAVSTLKLSGVTPALAVILVGDDAASLSYIKQKQKAADRIGARLIFEQMPDTIPPEALSSAIAHYNADPLIHGLIVQRPVPDSVGNVGDILSTVSPGKDIDGFVRDSPFEVPVAKAVLTILMHIHADLSGRHLVHMDGKKWLNTQRIVIIGRGDTAGKPVNTLLTKYDCATSVIHSKTPSPRAILKNADIIISCVGKQKIVTLKDITPGVILISVGLSRGKDMLLHGDYESDDIQDTAAYFTPTPGGVGPVNVASLMQNLVNACILQTQYLKNGNKA